MAGVDSLDWIGSIGSELLELQCSNPIREDLSLIGQSP